MRDTSVDFERGEIEVRASVGRLGQGVRRLIAFYGAWWRRSRTLAFFAHLSLVLGGGWLMSSMDFRIGELPKYQRLRDILEESGYYQVDDQPTREVIRGRSALKIDFAMDAHEAIGIVSIYRDLNDESDVIAMTSYYKDYTSPSVSEEDPYQRYEASKRRLSEMYHELTIVSLVRNLASVDASDIQLSVSLDSSEDIMHLQGVAERSGMIVEAHRWQVEDVSSEALYQLNMLMIRDRSFGR